MSRKSSQPETLPRRIRHMSSTARQHPDSSPHTMYTCLDNRFDHISRRGPINSISSPAYKSSQKHPLGDCPPHESTHVSSAGGDGGSKHCTSTSAPSFRHRPPAYNDPLLINSYLQARLRLGSSLRKMYICGPQTKGIKDSNTLTDSHRSFCLGANLQIVTEASTGRLSPA